MNAVTTVEKSDMQSGFSMDDSQVPVKTGPKWAGVLIGASITLLVALFVTDRLFNPQKFQIKEIEVHGRFSHVDGTQVKQIVEAGLKGNYFSVSLHRLENKIRQIPWVFSASLRRQWPSTIVVDIVEVQPVATWGDSRWLNFTGDLVDRPAQANPESSYDLPILYGPESDKKIIWKAFQRWSERFASSGLSLDELRLDSTGLWSLKLSLGALALNGDQSSVVSGDVATMPPQVTMVVDKANAFSHIQRFIKALNQELIVQFPQMKSIDLRYPNGFAISWHGPGPVAQVLTDHGFKSDKKIENSFE